MFLQYWLRAVSLKDHTCCDWRSASKNKLLCSFSTALFLLLLGCGCSEPGVKFHIDFSGRALLHKSSAFTLQTSSEQDKNQLLGPALGSVLSVLHAPVLICILLSSSGPFCCQVRKAALLSHHFLVTEFVFHQGWKCLLCPKEDDLIMERYQWLE